MLPAALVERLDRTRRCATSGGPARLAATAWHCWGSSRAARRQPLPHAFDQATGRVNDHGPGPHQRRSRLDDGQIPLPFGTAVLDSLQEFRTPLGELRQLFSIPAIVSYFFLGHRLELACIGQGHFVPQLRQ